MFPLMNSGRHKALQHRSRGIRFHLLSLDRTGGEHPDLRQPAPHHFSAPSPPTWAVPKRFLAARPPPDLTSAVDAPAKRFTMRRAKTREFRGNSFMIIFRRHTLALLVAIALLPAPAAFAETIRVGLPTKTYWPTTVAETAVRQKLFEK